VPLKALCQAKATYLRSLAEPVTAAAVGNRRAGWHPAPQFAAAREEEMDSSASGVTQLLKIQAYSLWDKMARLRIDILVRRLFGRNLRQRGKL
jgi:hypothetical protein